MGYHRAGFDVIGIDVRPQPFYPFRFIQADALMPPVRLEGFAVIHASAPCQAYTHMSNRWRGKDSLADRRPDLIGPVREMLIASGQPYVIENVRGAPLRNPITLTGEMFGLRVHRPRLFECSEFLLVPQRPRQQYDPTAVYGKRTDGRHLRTRADGTKLLRATIDEARKGMGMDWCDWDGLREAIPPAYTQWIGEQLLPLLAKAA